MKKRLLSAALALAMVLTLLPVSAFAVEYTTAADEKDPDEVSYTDSKGDTHLFYEPSGSRVSTVTVQRAATSDPSTGRVQGHWYWLDNKTNKDTYTYYEATTGLVTGTGGSGQWYPDVTAYSNDDGDKVKGAFTILDSTALSSGLGSYKDSSLTICLNGVSAANLAVPTIITSLRLTNGGTGWFPSNKGSVNAITTARGSYDGKGAGDDGTSSGLTITADDIAFGKITTKGRANTLNLTNCTVAGIDMDGTTDADAAGTKHNYNAQKVTMTGGSITDNVELTGDGSTISLTSVNANGQDITVVSNGGSISVSGASKVEDIVSTARTKTGNYPSVTVSGGTVGNITRTPNTGDESDNGISITVSGGNTTAGNIGEADGATTHLGRNTIKVTSATVGTIETTAGTLTIDGNGTKTGAITLDNTADSSGLTLSVGSTSTGLDIGGIDSENTKLKINSWPTNRDNKFGEVDLGDYGGHGIKGGTFDGRNNYGTAACLGWFDTNLQFRVWDGTAYKLYGKDELGKALSDLGPGDGLATGANATSAIIILGQSGAGKYLQVKNGSTSWGKVYFSTDSSIILPSEINSVKITNWIGPNGETALPGTAQAILLPAGDSVVINATDMTQDVTKILNVSLSSDTVDNNALRVTFKEGTTTIALSGAIKPGTGGLAVVRLNLTTDVIDTSGQPVILRNVPVVYDENNGKTLKFDNWTAVGSNAYGAKVENGVLKLANGTTYTVTNGGLAVSAPNLGLRKDGVSGKSPIVVTFGGTLSSWKQEQKDELAEMLSGEDTGFTIGTNRAMAEAINAAQATITNETSVQSLVDRAQSYVWTNGNQYLDNKGNSNGLGHGKDAYGTSNDQYLTKHSGSISKPGEFADDAADIQDVYSKAYIVPYLVINVTDYNQNGTLTATLTPYYRVDVSDKDGYDDEEYYTVQTGRALSALTGDMNVNGSVVQVTFNDLPSAFTENSYMHQDGQYVYKPAANGTALTWSISHAGANGTLGTMVINNKVGPIKLESDIASRNPAIATLGCTYDTLQAAVDDTVPGTYANGAVDTCDTITVASGYTGSCAVNMTGLARTIQVKFEGNHDVVTGQGSTEVKSTDGFNYTIQLTKDTAPRGGNITISSATGGTASVSANPATAGSTVTVTLSASAGYTAAGVSVKDGSGKTVSVSGSGNKYTFTMPAGTATVTPSFSKTQSTTTYVSVGSPNSGSGTASTNTTGQVTPGTTVTVTTTPGAGQRTMGVYVTGATATRTGANTFTFTVPSGYTNVVVTPRFDANNGTLYEDVWSTEYYSNPVRWAVERGITNGESTYRFGSGNTCTREQMVTFLWRAAGSPVVTGVSNPFWDVRAGEYYYNAVLWAVKNGITKGVSANQFGVGQSVTRADAVTFLYRYAGSPNASTNSGFYDVNSREYYAKAVTWANTTGVTNGTTATTFSPSDPCLREQIVTFLYRNATGNRA